MVAEFGDIIEFDENGNTTDITNGNQKFQFSKILSGQCLSDGVGKRSEFFRACVTDSEDQVEAGPTTRTQPGRRSAGAASSR